MPASPFTFAEALQSDVPVSLQLRDLPEDRRTAFRNRATTNGTFINEPGANPAHDRVVLAIRGFGLLFIAGLVLFFGHMVYDIVSGLWTQRMEPGFAAILGLVIGTVLVIVLGVGSLGSIDEMLSIWYRRREGERFGCVLFTDCLIVRSHWRQCVVFGLHSLERITQTRFAAGGGLFVTVVAKSGAEVTLTRPEEPAEYARIIAAWAEQHHIKLGPEEDLGAVEAEKESGRVIYKNVADLPEAWRDVVELRREIPGDVVHVPIRLREVFQPVRPWTWFLLAAFFFMPGFGIYTLFDEPRGTIHVVAMIFLAIVLIPTGLWFLYAYITEIKTWHRYRVRGWRSGWFFASDALLIVNPPQHFWLVPKELIESVAATDETCILHLRQDHPRHQAGLWSVYLVKNLLRDSEAQNFEAVLREWSPVPVQALGRESGS